MSNSTKYPDWFNFNRQPVFIKPKPVKYDEKQELISTETLDGKYDHIVYQNDEVIVMADINGSDDWGLELEVRTYKKSGTVNPNFEKDLELWEKERAEFEKQAAEWPTLRAKRSAEMQLEHDKQEYQRLKKIFEPKSK